jgi:hypothetical protein
VSNQLPKQTTNLHESTRINPNPFVVIGEDSWFAVAVAVAVVVVVAVNRELGELCERLQFARIFPKKLGWRKWLCCLGLSPGITARAVRIWPDVCPPDHRGEGQGVWLFFGRQFARKSA